MANSKVKGRTVRAAAILTTSDVASSEVSLAEMPFRQLVLFADFTIGSLTNVIITPQVQVLGDATNWYDVSDPGTLTLTASGKKAIPLNLVGATKFRALAKGTGTVTSSSLTMLVGFTDKVNV